MKTRRKFSPNQKTKIMLSVIDGSKTVLEASTSIAEYVECYNTKRLNSSLWYVPPVEFEANYQMGVSKG